MLGLLFTAVVLSLLASLAVHYLFGGVRLQTPGEKVTPAARVHLSVLLGIFVLLKAAAYYLDRYGLLFNERDGRTGASYTDVNAVLPAKTILMFVALICAVAILANIFLRWVQLPAIAIVLLLLTSIVASGIYPAIVQQFSVKPNANEKEALYIGRNIEATRAGVRDRAGQRGWEGQPAVLQRQHQHQQRAPGADVGHVDDPERPPARPQHPQPDIPAAPAGPQRVRLPGEAGHRPLHAQRPGRRTTSSRSAS